MTPSLATLKELALKAKDDTNSAIKYEEAASPDVILKLLDIIEEYEMGLAFYAYKNNWAHTKTTLDINRKPLWKIMETIKDDCTYFDDIQEGYGGKLARETLKRVREI